MAFASIVAAHFPGFFAGKGAAIIQSQEQGCSTQCHAQQAAAKLWPKIW